MVLIKNKSIAKSSIFKKKSNSFNIGILTNKPDVELLINEPGQKHHELILGGTGIGKSYYLEHSIRNDINIGYGGLVLDPHGTLYDRILTYVSTHCPQKAKDIIFFNPTDENNVVGFNPLKSNSNNIDYVINSVTSSLLKTSGQVRSDSSPRISRWSENVIYTLIKSGATFLEAIPLLNTNKDELRTLLLENIDNDLILNDWLMYEASTPLQRQQIIEGIANRLRKLLRDRSIRNVISQQENNLDISEAMKKGKMIIVNLHGGEKMSKENSDTLGSLLLNEAFRCSLLRNPTQKLKIFKVYADEAANYITRDLALSLEQTRKYSTFFSLGIQHLEQLRKDDKYTYSSVMGCCKKKIVFGAISSEDAQVMAEQLCTPHINLKEVKNELYSTRLRNIEERRQSYSVSHSTSQGNSEQLTRNVSVSASNGISNSESSSKSISEANSTGNSFSNTLSHGSSESRTDTKSFTNGLSESLSNGKSTSKSEGTSNTQTLGGSESRGLSHGSNTTTSNGYSTMKGENKSETKGRGITESKSTGNSESNSSSVSNSFSNSSANSRNDNFSYDEPYLYESTLRGYSDNNSISSGNSTSDNYSNSSSHSSSSGQAYSKNKSLLNGSSSSSTSSSNCTSGNSQNKNLSVSQNASKSDGQNSSKSLTNNNSKSFSSNKSMADTNSHATANNIGESNTKSTSNNKTHSLSVSETQAKTSTNSESISASLGNSIGINNNSSDSFSVTDSPFMNTVEVQELSNQTFWSKDEQLFRKKAEIMGQNVGEAFIKIAETPVVQCNIHRLKDYVLPEKELNKLKKKTLKKSIKKNPHSYISVSQAKENYTNRQLALFGEVIEFEKDGNFVSDRKPEEEDYDDKIFD